MNNDLNIMMVYDVLQDDILIFSVLSTGEGVFHFKILGWSSSNDPSEETLNVESCEPTSDEPNDRVMGVNPSSLKKNHRRREKQEILVVQF